MPSTLRYAFTLIELLVVITIIVVLLAMLTPALDKAIYQAELAVCAAQQRGIATGIQTYAANNKRRFPNRPHTEGRGSPHIIRGSAKNATLEGRDAGNVTDDRPVFEPYFSLDTMNDPLNGAVDYDDVDDTSTAMSSYMLYFGTQRIADGVTHAGMKKLGDRWGWDGNRFNIMVGEQDTFAFESHGVSTSGNHPDKDGVMSLIVWQNADAFGDVVLGQDANIYTVVVARWHFLDGFARGPVDSNAAFADGSVNRTVDVKVDAVDGSPDDRLEQVPVNLDTSNVNKWMHVPLR